MKKSLKQRKDGMTMNKDFTRKMEILKGRLLTVMLDIAHHYFPPEVDVDGDIPGSVLGKLNPRIRRLYTTAEQTYRAIKNIEDCGGVAELGFKDA